MGAIYLGAPAGKEARVRQPAPRLLQAMSQSHDMTFHGIMNRRHNDSSLPSLIQQRVKYCSGGRLIQQWPKNEDLCFSDGQFYLACFLITF